MRSQTRKCSLPGMPTTMASTTGCKELTARTVVDPARSRIMRAIRSKNTEPELRVRKILTSLGLRYRIHSRKLPGRADIALTRLKKAIFVNGCFWHQHSDPKCRLRKYPARNLNYWAPKLARNRERDRANLDALKIAGWTTLVIWECQMTSDEKVKHLLKAFLLEPCQKSRNPSPSSKPPSPC